MRPSSSERGEVERWDSFYRDTRICMDRAGGHVLDLEYWICIDGNVSPSKVERLWSCVKSFGRDYSILMRIIKRTIDSRLQFVIGTERGLSHYAISTLKDAVSTNA